MRSFGPLVAFVAFVAVAVGCSKKTAPAPPDTGSPPGAPAADKDRLQGVWAPESVQADSPEEVPKAADMKSMRYQFHGDRLSRSFKGRVVERYTLVVKADQNPQILALTSANGKWEPDRIQVSTKEFREPEKHEWLYKFDGDKLVIAETTVPGLRPSDFKPRKWTTGERGKPTVPSVVVVTLTKTAEGPLADAPDSIPNTKR